MDNPRLTFNEPGHAHELTFSCYRRLKMLNTDNARELFLHHFDEARRKWKFEVWAYVLMPEHVHLLIHPFAKKYSVSAILRDIKRPVARDMLREIRKNAPATLQLLETEEGSHAFWQPGPGYDRNLFSPSAIYASIDYVHANPVKRGLCESELDWKWSSAQWYAGRTDTPFEVDRCPIVRPVDTSSSYRSG